jgi:hypothetical protein
VELLVVFPLADIEIVEKFVTEGVDAEIVIVPADAPTDTIPAPEMLALFPIVHVVDAAPSVFPAIVAVIVEYPAPPAGADMVIVPPEAPTDTAPAPERLKLLPMVTVVDAAPIVSPAIEPVIVE